MGINISGYGLKKKRAPEKPAPANGICDIFSGIAGVCIRNSAQ
jgi:hypothetical protein